MRVHIFKASFQEPANGQWYFQDHFRLLEGNGITVWVNRFEALDLSPKTAKLVSLQAAGDFPLFLF